MNVAAPLRSYSTFPIENTFSETPLKYPSTGTTDVTLYSNNVRSGLNPPNERNHKASFGVVIQYPSGRNFELTTLDSNEKSQQGSSKGIDCIEETKVVDIMLCASNSKEAFLLFSLIPPRKGDNEMSTSKNRDEYNIIMNNLRANPFYKKGNKDLLKEVNIKGHLSSKTPYIPIEHLVLKDAHQLKGHDSI